MTAVFEPSTLTTFPTDLSPPVLHLSPRRVANDAFPPAYMDSLVAFDSGSLEFSSDSHSALYDYMDLIPSSNTSHPSMIEQYSDRPTPGPQSLLSANRPRKWSIPSSMPSLSLGPSPANDSSTGDTSKDESSSSSRRSSVIGALHIAARSGNDRIVSLLLQYNADCNEIDGHGMTPLAHAVECGRENVVRLLLLRGARIHCIDGADNAPANRRMQRRSALHWAVLQRLESILAVLLKHCREKLLPVDIYDDTGRTPLHVAVNSQFEPGVRILLQFGADPQRKTCESERGNAPSAFEGV